MERKHSGKRKGKARNGHGAWIREPLEHEGKESDLVLWTMGGGGSSKGSRTGEEDSEPESQQNGDGHEEGHSRDAMAQGIDDLHCGEVGLLGETRRESQQLDILGKGGLTTRQVKAVRATPELPICGAGVPMRTLTSSFMKRSVC